MPCSVGYLRYKVVQFATVVRFIQKAQSIGRYIAVKVFFGHIQTGSEYYFDRRVYRDDSGGEFRAVYSRHIDVQESGFGFF